MKYTRIVSFFILLFSSQILSQASDTVFVHTDSLKEGQISITEPWQFHSGDDTTWALQDYDFSKWDTLRSWFDYDEEKWTGIGWFKKIMVIDSTLRNKSIALQMYHYGASEIYLNGTLVFKFGKVSTGVISEEDFQPLNIPIVLNLDSNLVYTLSIRYSNQKLFSDKVWAEKWFHGIGFKVNLRGVNFAFSKLISNSKISSGVNFGISGLYYSLAILYFFLFVFYARRIENLYYSLFTLFLGIVFTASYIQSSFYFSYNYLIMIKVVNFIAGHLVFLFYIAFLNAIFYKKMTKIFFFFLFFAVIDGLILFFNNGDAIVNKTLPFFIVLTTLEGLRVIILAITRKTKNAWIIGAGVISFATLITVISGFVVITGQLSINNMIFVVFFFAGLFSIPLSMSIYLAKDIALTNRTLEEQLMMVKKLSAKELEHQRKTAELELKAELEKAENDRKTKELEDARKLQLSLLPKSTPDFPEYEIAVHMETATEVGGDYYDFYTQNNILTVAVGDATGHGLNAGTMVTATKSLFNNFAASPDILDSLEKMSASLKKMNFRFLSMCLALLKIENSNVKISSAGMPPVYIYRKNEAKVEEVLLKGMPLGTVKNFPYQQVSFELKKGDVLFVYSDGFPELFNPNKELLGYQKIKDEFCKVALNTPSSIIDSFKEVINDWKGTTEVNDDITFVLIKKK